MGFCTRWLPLVGHSTLSLGVFSLSMRIPTHHITKEEFSDPMESTNYTQSNDMPSRHNPHISISVTRMLASCRNAHPDQQEVQAMARLQF